MELSPREATQLAAFFARRFPGRGQVDEFARSAGVILEDTLAGDQIAMWSTLIIGASAQHRLRRLAQAAARRDRGDDNLQEVCSLLAHGERRTSWLILGAFAALAAVLAFAGGAWLATRQPVEDLAAPTSLVALPAAESPAAESPAAESPAAESPAAESPAAESPATPPAVSEAPADPASAVLPPPGIPTEPTPRTALHQASLLPTHAASGPRVHGRCGGPQGQVIGYWYAGRQSPGAQGDTVTVPRATNVRTDYPDKHNDYNARAPLRCGLRAGDRLHLSQAPIQVPGDAWWVPLAAGDLESAKQAPQRAPH